MNYDFDDDNRVDFFTVKFVSFFRSIDYCVWVVIYDQSFNWYRVIWVLSSMRQIGDGGFIDNDEFIDNLLINLVIDVVVVNGS